VAWLQDMVQAGLDSAEIAARFTEKGLKRTQKAIQRKRERETRADPMAWHAMIAPAPKCAPRWDQPATIEAARALTLFDIHAPFHDAEWTNWVIGTAKRFGCTACIIGGDLVDFAAFSKWGRQERVEAEDEIRTARQIVRALARSFETVVYGAGNHEMRLPRITGNLLELRDAMEMFVNQANVIVSDYHYSVLVSNGVEFQIEHPKNSSSLPTRVPTKLAEKYHRHILSGHGHLWGQARDVSGEYWGIDVGVCADPERLAYNTKSHSTRPMMNQGAAMVLDGVPMLLEPAKRRLVDRLVLQDAA
jgi:hypothetical protein